VVVHNSGSQPLELDVMVSTILTARLGKYDK
jgi:hypothetical protein